MLFPIPQQLDLVSFPRKCPKLEEKQTMPVRTLLHRTRRDQQIYLVTNSQPVTAGVDMALWSDLENITISCSFVQPSKYSLHASFYSTFLSLHVRNKTQSRLPFHAPKSTKGDGKRTGWRSCERPIGIKRHLNSGSEGSEADLIIENDIFGKIFFGAWVVNLKIGGWTSDLPR